MAEGRPPRTQACDLVRIETTSGGQDDRFPLFRTGSGKSVTIKESSLRKAAAVLEGNGINKGDKITLDVGAKDEVFPMFSTGSGKLVTVKESSIRKAAAIFIGENMEKETPNLLQCGRNNHDGYEKSILGNPSSTEKALSIINIRRMPEASLWRIFTHATKHLSIKSLKKMTFTLLVVLLKLLEGLNGDGMSLGGPLIDISNITGDCMNMNRLSNEKRRPGKMNYVSPFKRPRSARFITPLKGSTSLLATGKMNGRSSKPSTTESSCCGRISTRYPFQLKRKNLKDFFGGPPTCQDLMVKCCITQSGSLPHEVSNMDADNAVTYRFYDASHHDEIGLEAFQVMLLKSGASSSNATKDSYSVACDLHSMQESVGQLKSTLAEPVESKGKYVENFQQNQGNIDQDADMCFSLDFPNGHLKTTGPVDSFRPKANSQNDDKELGVEESFCASTLCSGCNQTQATHSEINAAQQLIQAEQSILLNTSGDKEWVQSGDIDVLPNTAEHQQSFPAWTLFMTYLILVEPLMDGSRSDDCHRDEDMPKPKRTKRKSKRQTNEIEKPTLKHKKAFEKPDYVVENSPKKKFPHATRRRRRQVLFLCPIMRTFFLERIKNNHSGEEANQNVHRPVMKNDLEVVTKIQHRGGCRKVKNG
ncbi:BRCA2, helical [Musa troglodytarum]|uniref:BRCA2, helical n=2 Tax=Musa troglodytarum TaxID=320322 RepID=A0A9E7EQN4_9LILI|nr:BRCA2, helical [Musa troglodytarum]